MNSTVTEPRLQAVYVHTRPDLATPDRYLYDLAPRLEDPEYRGDSWPGFYIPAREGKGTVPVYLKKRISGGLIYYKLSRDDAKEGDYEPVGPGPCFFGFDEGASLQGFPLTPVYEHGVTQQQPAYPRYYYDLEPENAWGWTKGTPLFYAVSPAHVDPRAPPGSDPRPPGPPVTTRDIEDAITRFFDEDRCPELALAVRRVPGMAIAVVHCRDGAPRTVLKGYGVRRAGTNEKVSEETVFQIASVSKPIASTIVAALVGKAEGWDARMVTCDASFELSDPAVTAQVTLADLMAHRSGLPDHAGDWLEDIGYSRRAVLEQQALLPLDYFRTIYAYTNFGFTQAAVAAAAHFAGKGWEDASQALYERLRMNRTSARYADFLKHEDRAVGHQRFSRYPGQWEWVVPASPRDPDAQSPAGGVSTCVKDLAVWMRLQLEDGKDADGQPVVDPGALARTRTRYPDAGASYGLGWNVKVNGDLSHSGGFSLGTATGVVLWPKEKLGIVVLTNGEPIGLPEAVCYAFLGYVQNRDKGLPRGQTLGDSLRLWEKIMAQAVPVPKDEGYAELTSLPQRDESVYAGHYENPYYGAVSVQRREGGGLDLLLGPEGGKKSAELRPWKGDTFVYQTIGENAVGLSTVEFVVTDGLATTVRIGNLPYDADPKEGEGPSTRSDFGRRKSDGGLV